MDIKHTETDLQQTLAIMDRADSLRLGLAETEGIALTTDRVLKVYEEQGVEMPRAIVEQAVRDYRRQTLGLPDEAPVQGQEKEDWAWLGRRLMWLGVGIVGIGLGLPLLRLLFRLIERLFVAIF